MHLLALGVPILLMADLGFAMGASVEDVRRRGLWRVLTATTLTLAVAIFVMLFAAERPLCLALGGHWNAEPQTCIDE
jgi:hypothetical protein